MMTTPMPLSLEAICHTEIHIAFGFLASPLERWDPFDDLIRGIARAVQETSPSRDENPTAQDRRQTIYLYYHRQYPPVCLHHASC